MRGASERERLDKRLCVVHQLNGHRHQQRASRTGHRASSFLHGVRCARPLSGEREAGTSPLRARTRAPQVFVQSHAASPSSNIDAWAFARASSPPASPSRWPSLLHVACALRSSPRRVLLRLACLRHLLGRWEEALALSASTSADVEALQASRSPLPLDFSAAHRMKPGRCCRATTPGEARHAFDFARLSDFVQSRVAGLFTKPASRFPVCASATTVPRT